MSISRKRGVPATNGQGDGPALKRRRSSNSSSTLSSAGDDDDDEPAPPTNGDVDGENDNSSEEDVPIRALVNSQQGKKSSLGPPTQGSMLAAMAGVTPSAMSGSRTVPEHQPGTPHADLHNDGAVPSNEQAVQDDLVQESSGTGVNGDGRPLDEVELERAIKVKLEQEDDGEAQDESAVKEKVKEVEVAKMVAGQGVDDAAQTVELKPRERPAQLEERLRIIRFLPVTSSIPSLTTSILLTGLKNIFQRQLPKMPREYITRLVFDRNHWSLAIVKKGYQVVGGITYRPFERRGFAEIVFCAIEGREQVRGYGSHLMNHLKDWVRSAHPGVDHFLTYADNYASGYFKKQGFTSNITLPRSMWAGYIKDYEGATIMQCTMLPRVAYLDVALVLLKQKQLILQKIRENSNSHVIHSGKELWEGKAKGEALRPEDVPALREIGWNPSMDALTRRPERGPSHAIMRRLLTDIQNHPASWAFARPVNGEEVTDYYDVVTSPMDLETMEAKLNAGKYAVLHFPNPAEPPDARPNVKRGLKLFLADMELIWNNCRRYNSDGSNYSKNAEKLRRFLEERVKAYTEDS